MNPAFNATAPWPAGGHQRTAAIRALPAPAAKAVRQLSPEMHVAVEPAGVPAAGAIEPAARPLPVVRGAEEATATDRMPQAQSDVLAVVAHELRNCSTYHAPGAAGPGSNASRSTCARWWRRPWMPAG